MMSITVVCCIVYTDMYVYDGCVLWFQTAMRDLERLTEERSPGPGPTYSVLPGGTTATGRPAYLNPGTCPNFTISAEVHYHDLRLYFNKTAHSSLLLHSS